jgi:hypothetical protein
MKIGEWKDHEAFLWFAHYHQNVLYLNKKGTKKCLRQFFELGHIAFFFNSREETRRHVHVATPDGTTKFRLEPTIALASYHQLNQKELNRIDALVREYENEFKSAWNRHFEQ